MSNKQGDCTEFNFLDSGIKKRAQFFFDDGLMKPGDVKPVMAQPGGGPSYSPNMSSAEAYWKINVEGEQSDGESSPSLTYGFRGFGVTIKVYVSGRLKRAFTKFKNQVAFDLWIGAKKYKMKSVPIFDWDGSLWFVHVNGVSDNTGLHVGIKLSKYKTKEEVDEILKSGSIKDLFPQSIF